MSQSFYRLSPFIQEFIYRNHWNELRDVQTRAISAVLDSDSHVLIAAGTASGKTEAAFFPILTKLYDSPPNSFGAIYIGPLKALINDQFERLYDLLEQADIPVFAWHGDRSAAEKSSAVKTNRGIIQITPESIEALLMNRAGEIKRMFSDLRFVVIDEVHAFQGQDRGLQLLCQLKRIETIAGCSPRRVGLSATIYDYGAAKKWLAAGTSRQVEVIESGEGGRKLNLAMEYFPEQSVSGCSDTDGESGETVENGSDAGEEKSESYIDYLYRQVRGRKCIIFTNSRSESEKAVHDLRERAKQLGEPDIFFAHHGSLSSTLRHESELALKNAQGPAVAAATRTLELGIDLGSLQRVVQFGAPYTCSSFVQRLGRSGRRGTPAEMRFIVLGQNKGKGLFSEISWSLIQNIAIVQLYLERKWVETPGEKPSPYSVLFHQTLSILAQSARKPAELARRVLTLPTFEDVTTDDFRLLLKHMIETRIIEKVEDGDLIVGLNGERLTDSFHFYSVFKDSSGIKVISKDGEIGEIDFIPEQNDVLLLAGRKWRVTLIDEKRLRVFVEPSKTLKQTKWRGGGGDVDDVVVRRMLDVLTEDAQYGYLQKGAWDHLSEAREITRASGLTGDYTYFGEGHLMIHPWLGTKKLNTLRLLLEYAFKNELGIYTINASNFFLEIFHDPSAGDVYARCVELILNVAESDIDLKAYSDARLMIDRYDRYIPRALLEKAFIKNAMDVEGLKESFRSKRVLA